MDMAKPDKRYIEIGGIQKKQEETFHRTPNSGLNPLKAKERETREEERERSRDEKGD